MEPEEIRKKNLLALTAHLGLDTKRMADMCGVSPDYLRQIERGYTRADGTPYKVSRGIARKVEVAFKKALPQLGEAWMERPHWEQLPPAVEPLPHTTGRYPTLDAPTQLKLLWPRLTPQERSAIESLVAAFSSPKSDREAG